MFALFVLPSAGFAGGLAMQNLDVEDYKGVVRNFSANLTHTSVSGAAGLGGLLGFQFGFISGRTWTPEIHKQVQEMDPQATRDYLPHMKVLGVLTVPLGFTVESSILPKIGTSDFKYNSFSLAVKWAPTDMIPDFPVKVAVKAHAQDSFVEYDYRVGGMETRHEYRSIVTGATAFLSVEVVDMVEPYIGAGVVTGTGTMTISGSDQVFSDPTFKANREATARVASPQYMIGIEFRMGTINLAFEYANQFNVGTFSGKFALLPF